MTGRPQVNLFYTGSACYDVKYCTIFIFLGLMNTVIYTHNLLIYELHITHDSQL